MYVYIKSERYLWTAGHYDPGSHKWISESDHSSEESAADRVHWLNGGDPKHEWSAASATEDLED